MVSRVYLFLVGWVWLMLPLILPLDANHIPSSPIKSHQIPSKPLKNPTIYSLSFPHLIPSILPLTQAEVHKVEDQLGPTPRKTLRRPGEARSFPAIKRGFLMAFHQPKIWWLDGIPSQPKIWWPHGMVILISWGFLFTKNWCKMMALKRQAVQAPGRHGFYLCCSSEAWPESIGPMDMNGIIG